MIEKFINKHNKRIVGLDILRSIAILIVVYGHGAYLFPRDYWSILSKLNIFQIDGVSVFFLLSGFLIGNILLTIIRDTDFTIKDLINFWIRRWFRTIPNYILVILCVIGYNALILGNIGEFNYKYFLFAQNFASSHPSFFGEAWSLAVEEWFYLLFPLTCFGIYRIFKKKTKAILFSAIVFLLIPLILRIVKYELGVDNFDLQIRKIVILRLDSLMYGIVASYLFFKLPTYWIKFRHLFLGIGLFLLVMLYFNPFDWKNFYMPIYFNIESITVFCLLPFFSCLKTTGLKLIDSFFIFISLISYSMYLLNLTPIQEILIPNINWFSGRFNLPIEEVLVLNYVIYWSATILGSCFLYRFFENPMTNLRDKIKL